MKDKRFHGFPHRQIPVFIVLSLVPGLGYLLLGWLNDVLMPALVRYMLMIATSIWLNLGCPDLSQFRLRHDERAAAGSLLSAMRRVHVRVLSCFGC
ncbi:MAG: hypothetical protein WA108_03800 [Thiobacillus sp.]|jgi:hypothetical protein